MSRNNQIRQNLCDLLWRQNSVGETNIFTQILQYTQSGCRWDVSLPLADLPIHSEWSVATTYSLVGSDLKYSLYQLFSPVTAKCSASVIGNPSIAFFFSSMRNSKIQDKHLACFLVTTLTIIRLWHCATDPPLFTITVPLFHHPLLSLFHCSTTMYYHCSTVPPPFTTTVPLFYHPSLSLFHHPSLSLFHCSTTLYYHCSTVPPPFTTTVPLFHHPLLSLFHCSTTRHYHCFTVPPPVTITLPLFYHPSLSLFHCSTTLHYHCSTAPPPFTITVPLFYHPSLSLFHCSTTLHYHCSTVPPPFTRVQRKSFLQLAIRASWS